MLPPEILGWILLRRAGLTAAQRLSVLAACGNSLHVDDIETALRNQDEELLAGGTSSSATGSGRHAFWVEESGYWTMLNDDQVQDENIDWSESVYWGSTDEGWTDSDEQWVDDDEGWEEFSWVAAQWGIDVNQTEDAATTTWAKDFIILTWYPC